MDTYSKSPGGTGIVPWGEVWACCCILVDFKFFNRVGGREGQPFQTQPQKQALSTRCRARTAEAKMPETQECAPPEPSAARQLDLGARPRVPSSPPRVPETETPEGGAAQAPEFALANLACRAPEAVGLGESRERPQRCRGASYAPKVVAWQGARAAGPRAAGWPATRVGRPGAGTGAAAAAAPQPLRVPLAAPRPQVARRMEIVEEPGPGGGQEATPERRGPCCLQLAGFREELRALLALAGPAVSKVVPVGGWPRRVGGPARVSLRVA